jgi:hypothetical protein
MRHASFHGNECSNIRLDWGHIRSLTFFCEGTHGAWDSTLSHPTKDAKNLGSS